MFGHPLPKTPLVQGLFIGLAFGVVNLLFTWISPRADDTAGAVLRFYGPMFFLWAFCAYSAARRTGRLLSGAAAGAVVAFWTFCVFEVFALLRVNLFLRELTGRADWQNMMLRFRASEFESLRVWVNLDYLKGAPLKLGVAALIGTMMGTVGGSLGHLRSRRTSAAA
jgi:hypothetical protein